MDNKQFYIVAGLVQGVFLIFFLGNAGTVEIDKAIWWCIIASGLLLTGRAGIIELKHKSPQVITEKFSDSYSGTEDIQKAGEYRVIHIGGWRAFGLHRRGDKATIIVPEGANTLIGSNLAINCDIQRKKNLTKLPLDVYKQFEDLGIRKPVYAGFGTKEQKELSQEELKHRYDLSEPDVSRLENMVEQKQQFINELDQMLEETTSTLEDVKDHQDRMNGGGGSGIKAMWNSFKKDKGEE